jgi:solute carrier family 25 carnitine/acylcarnitine transporter 20/29
MEIETKYNSKDPNDYSENKEPCSNIPTDNHLDLERILKDLAAGSIAGVANVLSGHPFDTIKVRMQMLDTKLIPCIQSIVSKEGITSLYKGVYSPLFNVPVVNAVIFGAYEMALRFLGASSSADIPLLTGVIAGSFSGLVNCVLVTPVELLKCRQQEWDIEAKLRGLLT